MGEIQEGRNEENPEEKRMWLAHISEDGLRDQTMKEHLSETAKLAQGFAEKFEAGDYGWLSGMLHDIGKYSLLFQKRLRGAEIRVDHSTAGAKLLYQMYKEKKILPVHQLVAVGIAGHHSGLPDWGSVGSVPGEGTMEGRFKKKLEDFSAWETEVSFAPLKQLPATLSDMAGKTYEEQCYSVAFFIRMLFSCLVDADCLNTEEFMNPETYQLRKHTETMKSLWRKAEEYQKDFQKEKPCNQLNGIRKQILEDCLLAAEKPRGLFRLTVPTGGGKTLSSMAFALKHAKVRDMERIVYIVPYTSIIEQNAEVFRNVVGAENVLEHHSNADYESLEEIREGLGRKLRLATENWEIPVVVTTSVQFFESLYGNRTAKCRKIHNLTGSVLVFDEAQMLPCDYLRPCVKAIEELVEHYHCTAVLCTATQPPLGAFFKKMQCTEICQNFEVLYEQLRRTTFVKEGILSQEELLKQLEKNQQVLCIVNNKERAQELFDKMEEDGRFHLSTRLYPVHRKRMIDEIKERLREKKNAGWLRPVLWKREWTLIFRVSSGSLPDWIP